MKNGYIQHISELPAEMHGWVSDYRWRLMNNATKEEKKVIWYLIRKGRPFVFQAPFYFDGAVKFADFYFPQLGYVLEIDGPQHRSPSGILEDAERNLLFAKCIIRTFHFENSLVANGMINAIFGGKGRKIISGGQRKHEDLITDCIRDQYLDFVCDTETYEEDEM